MNKIILLPPEISRKIAAGEVVERPYSVVRELVDNALDAGAEEVKIELVEGGKRLIKVIDNGCGMAPEDAELCFERHSTSKISKAEHLAEISTLGFRGEALPSISAVSRVVLKTSDGKRNRGTLIEREGEKLLRLEETAFPRGTSVEVKDLFYNMPARRKFLRSDRTELGMIVRHVTWQTLAFPEVGFSLTHNRKEIFHYPGVTSFKERLFQIYGKSVLEKLDEVDFQEDFHLTGFVSRPPYGRRDRSHQLFFVNRRPVKDRIFVAALNNAFQGMLEKDLQPEAFLFLYLPYSEVDVNVHPAKAEVRFRDSQQVFLTVSRGIRNAFFRGEGVKEVYPSKKDGEAEARIEERKHGFFPLPPGMPTPAAPSLFGEREEDKPYPTVLGQYLDTYIIASSEEGIFIIDQHNAHERVLFEKYLEIDVQGKWPRKISLLPLLIELSPSQELVLESSLDLLEEMGFRVESMGQRSFALKEFPDIFQEKEAKDIFLYLLDEVKGEKVEKMREKILAALACRTAIKAGKRLTPEKMDYLVEELFKTSNFSLCPHGRPIVVRLERGEIERELKRK
ncbi:MAG: DNA mismatch repair endonuclease MutL [Candidatus Aminicenantales bacterium]